MSDPTTLRTIGRDIADLASNAGATILDAPLGPIFGLMAAVAITLVAVVAVWPTDGHQTLVCATMLFARVQAVGFA